MRVHIQTISQWPERSRKGDRLGRTTEVVPSSWVKHRTAVAEWWKTWRKAGYASGDSLSRELLKEQDRTERLLLEDEEDGVEELVVLEVVVDQVEELESL
jgi:hypothetical protein